MNKLSAFAFLLLFFAYFTGYGQQIPQLGIASPLANDSILYASGYRMLGESVSRMVSPKLSEEEFQKNISAVKNIKCEIYMCNVFFPADLKITGNVDEEKVLRFAEIVFKRAEILRIPAIVLGSGGARKLEEGVDRKTATDNFVLLGKKLGNLAKRHNVKIFLENLNSTETNFITSLKEGAEIVKRINHPNFRLNADIYHMMVENESPQSIIEAGKVIEYCEIAEKKGRTRPGVNGDDFLPYFKALKQIGFSGNIFIEGKWTDLTKEAPLAKEYIEKQLRIAYTN